MESKRKPQSRKNVRHKVARRVTLPDCLNVLKKISDQLTSLTQAAVKQKLGSEHLAVPELAAYIGLSVDSIRRKIRNREIPFHERPGFRPYFLKSEINRWLEDPATLRSASIKVDEPDNPTECVHDQESVERILARAKAPPRRAKHH